MLKIYLAHTTFYYNIEASPDKVDNIPAATYYLA